MSVQNMNDTTLRQVIHKMRTARKAVFDVASGLTGVNLEAPAKLLHHFLPDFIRTIPRTVVPGDGFQFKAINAVTPSGSMYPGHGIKANKFTTTTADKSFAYRTWGRGGDVPWEAEVAGRNFEDPVARAQRLNLMQLMQEESNMVLGANEVALGALSAPTVNALTSGGTLADATYSVVVAALTVEGWVRAKPLIHVPADYKYDASGTTPTFDNEMGVTPASSATAAVLSGGGGNGAIDITFTPNPKAVAYAIFVDPAGGTAHRLEAVVYQSRVILTGLAGTGPLASTITFDSSGGRGVDADYERPNGILAQITAPGSGAYVRRVNGFLSDPDGTQIPELRDMIVGIYEATNRAQQPDRFLVSWDTPEAISRKLAGVQNDRLQYTIPVDQRGIIGPPMQSFYQSPIGNKLIPIEVVPNLPGGMIIAMVDNLMIPGSLIPNPVEIVLGADYTRISYAQTAPMEDWEIRVRGCVAVRAPLVFGVLYDIHNDMLATAA